MSYILEALRRSQAERERGHVPGLHAQPVSADTTDDTRRAAPAPWVLWLAAGAGLLALVTLLLWWTRPAPVVVAAAPAPATGTVPAPVPGPVATPDASPGPTPSTPAAAPTAPRSLPIVVSAPPVVPAPVPAVPAATPSPASPSTAASTRSTRALTVSELSPEQRRELPPLVLGGSVWSDNAASRFVIFNGQIVHEGQPAAPGVVVERIGPKAAQLRWRGVLFEVAL